MKNIIILISGRGSNMQAIVNANMPNVRIAAVICNNPDASGLLWAREKGINTAVVNHREYPSREEYDRILQSCIDGYQPDLIVLAGFMRIFTAAFVQHYSGRMINIHPSLLPAFTGLDTHQRAIASGCKIAGCTVHFVTEELDHGPIITQAVVPVLDHDTEEHLAARVLAMEHKIYPQAIVDFLNGAFYIDGLRVSRYTNLAEPPGMIYG